MPDKVRAKFYVSELTQRKIGLNGQTGTVVKLSPVVDGSAENKEFYQYTPAGHIELGTVNEQAAKRFNVGDQFYVDFTKADE